MTVLTVKKIKDKLRKSINLAKALRKDNRIPRISKILLVMAVAYFFSPIDLIPDFVPILGQFDDAIIVPLLIYLAIKCVPKEVFLEHYKRIFNE